MHQSTYEALNIRGGRVIDPAAGRDEVADVAVVSGHVAETAPAGAHEIDATGLIVSPGWMDIHVHLRQPGGEHKETIETGTQAAAAGGFTYVACMPNTSPPLDHPDRILDIVAWADEAGFCEVGSIAAITRAQQGRELTAFEQLMRVGAIAFSDDGAGVEDDATMRAAFERAHALGAVLIQHCEYKSMSSGGVMHLGDVSRRIGLPGMDPRSEEAMIERDVALCRDTGGRYHVAHVSTARAVDLVRRAKGEGLPVTCEVTPHHLILTDEACATKNPNTKMHPPLRTQGDVDACRQGLLDGTIDCVATDHAPHTEEEKGRGFLEAPPGIVGLETALGLTHHAMIASGLSDWRQLIEWFTTGPAGVLNLPLPCIQVAARANLTLIDPDERWTVSPADFASKGRNTPFGGMSLVARAVATVVGDRLISPHASFGAVPHGEAHASQADGRRRGAC